MKTTTPTATSLPELVTVGQLQKHLQIGRPLAYEIARKHGIRIGNGKLLRIPRERITAMTTA